MTKLTFKLSIIGLWALLVMAYGVYFVQSQLLLPNLEGYEKEWKFQLFSFAITRVPFLVILLVLVFFLQGSFRKKS